jgi:hypothetical protein
MKIPSLGKAYQTLLKATDEEQNLIIAEKTRAYNRAHYNQRVSLNADISKRPEVLEFNRMLTQEMWNRMPELRTKMAEFRQMYPYLSISEFNTLFWSSNVELRQKMSEIRKEIAEELRNKTI